MAKKRSPAAKQPRPDRRAAPPAAAPKSFVPSAAAVRETVESLVVAFILAFLFRTFEAEAFVIPTGSMAPTLMGAHKDLNCPECGYWYTAGASSESDDRAQQAGYRGPLDEVVDVTCPLCRFPVNVDPNTPDGRKYPTYGGDRILVSKFIFDFMEPRRWDVTVFKFPGGAETNYIKRLIGLPNETVRVWHGDVYVKAPGENTFHLERRPADKLQAMKQIVYDNNYLVEDMVAKGWPLRWQTWAPGDADAGADQAGWNSDDGSKSFTIDGSASETRWLGYRHFVPSLMDWQMLDRGDLPSDYQPRPSLITDFYAYDTSVQRSDRSDQPQILGRHWVGDLLLECDLEVTRPEGKALFELVEGGVRFRCTIDVATGMATLSIDGHDDYHPQAQTRVHGAGSHTVEFANVDDQLLLWIDGESIAFDSDTSYGPLGNDRPKTSNEDPGDLLPAHRHEGAGLQVSNLRLWRDIYYIAASRGRGVSEYSPTALLNGMTYDQLAEFWRTPSEWQSTSGPNPFDQREEAVFPLEDDQFFMMGDNSPLSLDARLWQAEPYVDRSLLVGKALYIFWPHSYDKLPGTNIPFPYFPNFARMGFIR